MNAIAWIVGIEVSCFAIGIIIAVVIKSYKDNKIETAWHKGK